MIAINIEKKLKGAGGDMLLKADLKLEEKSFVAFAGQSGSGKTTLLRIIAGLESVDKGTLHVGSEVWLDGKFSLPPQKRKIGFVFQDYALFPNMSVENNLLYVNKDRALCNELLEMSGLGELAKRLPATLSGGQKQRVSLCRAMMNRPKILLMDEPLSALDPSMRSKLQQDILTIHKAFGTTTVIVSHDPSEVYRLAERVIVINLGEIIKDGNPRDILLKQSGSQKFTLQGEILEISQVDAIHVATISIGQQIVEVVIDEEEAGTLVIGEKINVSTKAFFPMISRMNEQENINI